MNTFFHFLFYFYWVIKKRRHGGVLSFVIHHSCPSSGHAHYSLLIFQGAKILLFRETAKSFSGKLRNSPEKSIVSRWPTSWSPTIVMWFSIAYYLYTLVYTLMLVFFPLLLSDDKKQLGAARALFLWIGTARALYLLQLPILARKGNHRRYGAPAVPLRQGIVASPMKNVPTYFFIIT